MKRFYYACLGLLLLASLHRAAAQGITNLNLDSWATRGTVEKPQNWLTLDDIAGYYDSAPSGTYAFGLTTKTTDKHGGQYAAKITTDNITYKGQTGLSTGALFLGAKTGVYYDPYLFLPLGGAPLAGRPTSMQFYYKLNGPAADSTLAFVYLTTSTSGTPNLIGLGYQLLTPASAYTNASVPISYANTTATPDSVHVIFLSSSADRVTQGTALYVDDVSFSGVALASKAATDVQDRLTVSPNPSAGGRVVVSSPTQPGLAAAPLQVFDMRGRLVLKQGAQSSPVGQRELDLSSLSAGLYLLRLDSQQGTIVRQLTVQ